MTNPIFSNQPRLKIFDSKLILKTFIVLSLLIIPFNVIHETGHGIPCYLEGKEFKINIGLLGSSIQCFGNVENKTLFRISGGLFAVVISVIPCLVFRTRLQRYPYFIIALLSMTAGQGANMLMETAFYNDYISNGMASMIIINAVQYLTLIYLVFHFSKLKSKKETENE